MGLGGGTVLLIYLSLSAQVPQLTAQGINLLVFIPTAAVALRSPYELKGLPETVWAIAAYEYSRESIRAAAKVLRGELLPTGKVPVQM